MTTSFKAQLLWDNIGRGDLSAVHTMLEGRGMNLEERDSNGCSFLMVACELGAVNIVRELLQAGVDPGALDHENWNALLCASKEGHLEIVMELLEMGVELEHTDMCGWTALMWACYRGHSLVVSELLERGATPNVKADHNMTCLSWAAGRGHTDIVKQLIDKGAKVNMADKYGTTALIWACRRGHVEIVDVLLAEGSAVDSSGMNSWTPLLVATKGGHFGVVHSVLNQDPNVNATDKDGLTALSIASKEGYSEIANDLLRKGAYVNLVDRNGDSILVHAVKGGHMDIVSALLKKYVDVDVAGQDGKSAIYHAVEKGYTDIVKLLLKSSPDLELCTKDEDNPLLRAVRLRSEECVRLLLDKGAKVSHSDKRGDTALHIAIRARAKRITEILLSSPRHSRLLYRLNKAGESPYSMDTNHQRGILPQIYGHGKLNATDAENLLGYEIYSSALADILSEPGLMTPITMGLYAKWGSGKSFLLDKLRSEMRSFTQQNSPTELTWSWLTAFLLLLLHAVLGEVLGLLGGWEVGVAVGVGLLALMLGLLGLLICVTSRHDVPLAARISGGLARKQKLLVLFVQMLFCLPRQQDKEAKQAITAICHVRFLFSDCTRLTSVGGEKSLAAMIGTLCDATEAKYGMLIARLFRVFKPAIAKPRSRFKTICCIPYFVIFLLILACVMTGSGLAVVYGVGDDMKYVLISLAAIVGGALVVNLKTWGQMVLALAISQRRRVIRAADHLPELKMDGFMQTLKAEVDLMSRMVTVFDSFTMDQTRLVVVVDGLDSCEQDKVLQVLDTVKSLFSDDGAPFITVLAVDPHIIIKGIEQNLRSSFQDSNVNGFDYLRNVVHLPFYLQSQGMRIQQGDPPATTAGESPSRHGAARQESSVSETNRRKMSRALSTTAGGGSLSGSVPNALYASSFDLTTSMAKNDYFSDINPRSMRRLMNIVAVTARLLRAYNIDFKWHRLAAWINLIEQWPYRLSWVIYCFEETDVVENSASLHSLYKKVLPNIPSTKEQDPLLEIDRNVRKLEASLMAKSGNFPLLNVADMKKFLPCTINLDPYLRKLIRENQHNMERHQAEMKALGGVFPPPPPPPQGIGGARQKETTSTDRTPFFSSPNRYTSGQYNQPANMLYGHGVYPPLQSQVPYAAALAAALQTQQIQQQQPFQPYMTQLLQQQPNTAEVDSLNKQSSARLKQPGDFFTSFDQAVTLSKCSVQDVCDLLAQLKGLSPSLLPQYETSIRDNNISGLVLTMCDLAELQPVLAMRFGDWQLFKSAISALLSYEQEDTSNLQRQPSLHDPSKPPTAQKSMASTVNSQSTLASCHFEPKYPLRKKESMSTPEPGASASRLGNKASGPPPTTAPGKRMKRENSIVKELNYEAAILNRAVSDFVSESEEEYDEEIVDEEDDEEEEKDGGEGVQFSLDSEGGTKDSLDKGGSETKAVNKTRSDGMHASKSKTSLSKIVESSTEHLLGQSESIEEEGEGKLELNWTLQQKESLNSGPSFSISSREGEDTQDTTSSSIRDMSPYIQVLDQPGELHKQTSGEFTPLLGSIHLHSATSSTSDLHTEQVSSLSNIAELPFGQMSHQHQSPTSAQINYHSQSPSGHHHHHHHHSKQLSVNSAGLPQSLRLHSPAQLHTTSTEFIPTDSAEPSGARSRSHPDLNIDTTSSQQRASPEIVEAPLSSSLSKAAVSTSWSSNLKHFEAHSLSSGSGTSDQRDSLDDGAEGQGQEVAHQGHGHHHEGHKHHHLNPFRAIKSGIENLVEHLPAMIHHGSSHDVEEQHLKEMGIEEEHEHQQQQQQQQQKQQKHQIQRQQQQFSTSTSSASSGSSGGEVTLATIESGHQGQSHHSLGQGHHSLGQGHPSLGQSHRTGSVDHENMFQQSFSTIVEMSAERPPEVNFHQRLGQAFADVEELPDSKEASPDRETIL